MSGLKSTRRRNGHLTEMRSSHRGETALITGASTGIGYELALEFAANGFDLIVVARREDKLRALADKCRQAHGANVVVMPADLVDPRTPQELSEAVEGQGLRVDVLVNNAGVEEMGAFWRIDAENQIRQVQLNAVAVVGMTHAFLIPMVERGKGRILNISSVAAFDPGPAMATYAATKTFVLSLSEALLEELKGTGVTVTALCPGLTRTAMGDRVGSFAMDVQKVPDFMYGEASAVARVGYDSCMKGRAVVIPGLVNRIGIRAMRLLPRSLLRTINGRMARQAL